MNTDPSENVKKSSPAAHPEEQEWVRQAREGDEQAFRRLFERYFPKVYGTMYHMTQNAAVAEELAQGALVQAWRRLSQFDGRAGFGTWLYRIAVNGALDHLRRMKNRAAESLDAVMEEGREPASAEPDARSAAGHGELGRAIQEALGRLSSAHRAVFVLGEIEGRSYDEIGRILRCKRGTVMSRMHYARMHLQKLLRRFYETG